MAAPVKSRLFQSVPARRRVVVFQRLRHNRHAGFVPLAPPAGTGSRPGLSQRMRPRRPGSGA